MPAPFTDQFFRAVADYAVQFPDLASLGDSAATWRTEYDRVRTTALAGVLLTSNAQDGGGNASGQRNFSQEIRPDALHCRRDDLDNSYVLPPHLAAYPEAVIARQQRRSPQMKSWQQVYEAANRADFRGYFYLPSLNPAEQLDDMSLAALRERTDFLYKNVGAVTMLIDRVSLAEASTGIWPKWTTGAEDFDKAATDAFHFANHDPRVFSADGQNDAYSIQYAIRRCIGPPRSPTPAPVLTVSGAADAKANS